VVNRVIAPALAAVVERARGQAAASGELLSQSASSTPSPFDSEERELIAAWHASGEYDHIVAAIVAHDPDLATQ
jgi:hypothetical protein